MNTIFIHANVFFFFSSFVSGSSDKTTDETINIFSVASGHLYERFLRIMMLSVLKHTKSPVKFWFLKNYLSPTFKVFTFVFDVIEVFKFLRNFMW